MPGDCVAVPARRLVHTRTRTHTRTHARTHTHTLSCLLARHLGLGRNPIPLRASATPRSRVELVGVKLESSALVGSRPITPLQQT